MCYRPTCSLPPERLVDGTEGLWRAQRGGERPRLKFQYPDSSVRDQGVLMFSEHVCPARSTRINLFTARLVGHTRNRAHHFSSPYRIIPSHDPRRPSSLEISI